jgi:hypothetical protein
MRVPSASDALLRSGIKRTILLVTSGEIRALALTTDVAGIAVSNRFSAGSAASYQNKLESSSIRYLILHREKSSD